jgi:hypothetical protein
MGSADTPPGFNQDQREAFHAANQARRVRRHTIKVGVLVLGALVILYFTVDLFTKFAGVN